LSLIRWTNTPWFSQIGNPVTGSFSAGPINHFFSVGQTLTTGDAEIARVDMKITRGGGRDGAFAQVEVKGFPNGRSLRSGSVQLLQGAAWYSFTFPPITADESGGKLLIEVRSLPENGLGDRDLVSVSYQHGDPYAGGQMYIRGRPARPDWDLAFRMYQAVGLRDALAAIGRWRLVGAEVPWLTALSVTSALCALVLLARRRTEGQSIQLWTSMFVALVLLAFVLHMPEAIANPAITTVYAGLQ